MQDRSRDEGSEDSSFPCMCAFYSRVIRVSHTSITLNRISSSPSYPISLNSSEVVFFSGYTQKIISYLPPVSTLSSFYKLHLSRVSTGRSLTEWETKVLVVRELEKTTGTLVRNFRKISRYSSSRELTFRR